MKARVWLVAVFVVAAFLPILVLSVSASATTERVSVGSTGEQGNGDSGCADSESAGYPSVAVSADGSFVAFTSRADNLVPGDTNGKIDIFVRNWQTHVTERMNISSSGEQANLNSFAPSVSTDGRYVAFVSFATNLVTGDTNGYPDVFVRDRQSGTTERVSVSSSGDQGNGKCLGDSATAISPDGRYVAFASSATNLITGDTNGYSDVFVRDRQSGTTERASVSSSGAQGDSASLWPSISADGRFVSFYSYASNLVPSDTNAYSDVFVRDLETHVTERLSVSSTGQQGNYISGPSSISADGRYVAFESQATNLVAGDTNGGAFVRDREAGTTERVSVGSSGEQLSWAHAPSISADGRYVAFEYGNVWVRDRQIGVTELVSIDGAGEPADQASAYWNGLAISADGQCVVFTSAASDLVLGDTNGLWDVFVRDREGTPGAPVLQVVKSPSDSLASPGSDVVFTIECANTGDATAQAALLTDPLDPLFTFVSATDGWSYDPGLRTVTWSLGSLDAGASRSVSVTVNVSDTAAPGTDTANQATLSATGVAPVVSNSVIVSATPIIDEVVFTPDSLSSETDVLVSVNTRGAARVELEIAGLTRSQPAIPLIWNGSNWEATISGSLAAWAEGDALDITALAYDSTGRAMGVMRSLPVTHEEPPPGTGDPTGVWIDYRGSYGILSADADLLFLGPPLEERLSMTTWIHHWLVADGPMNLWPAASYTQSAGAEVQPMADGSLDATLAAFGRFSPLGGPAYGATFQNAGETATFYATMDATAVGLTLWDITAGVAGIVDPDLPDLSPTTLLETYDAFAHLAPVRNALEHFTPWPSAAQLPGAVLVAAWDLSELVTNDWERQALGKAIEVYWQEATGNPNYKLPDSRWIAALSKALSFYELIKIFRDASYWCVYVRTNTPALIFTATPGPAGTLRVQASGALAAAGDVIQGESTNLTYGAAEIDSEIRYDFTLSNSASAAVWELQLDFTPSSPLPTSVLSPAGWQAEVVANSDEQYVRWYTQGPGGWASGDAGPYAIAQDGSLSGFTLYLPAPLEDCVFSTMNAELLADAGMVAMTPGIVAVPPEFAPGAGETTSLVSHVDRSTPASVAVYRKGTEYLIVKPEQLFPVGESEVTWDGRDADGRLAPAGWYEARLTLQYASGPTQVAAPVLVGFSDLPWDFWARPHIYELVRAEIVAGYPDGTYHPELPVGRDQMAVYIARAIADGDASVPDPGCSTQVFTDVDCDHWARKYIQFCVSQGVVEGYPEGDYKPDLEVTRDQMAVYVARALVAPNGEAALAGYLPSDPRDFPDVPTDFWAWKHVEYCVEHGVVSGYEDGLYHPERMVTRDQMAVYVARAFALAP